MSARTHLTDEHLVADLRKRGVVGPVSADFLTDYRRDREFMELATRVEAIPGAPAKFKRALIRLGILPPDEPGDATLLGAWERFKTAEREIEANGPDASEETDAPAMAAWDAADDVVLTAPATTIEGAIVKLRRSILMTTSGFRPTAAIINDDDTDLFAQAEDLDTPTQLVIDALAALMLVRDAVQAEDPAHELESLIAQRDAALKAYEESPDEGGRLEEAYQASVEKLDEYQPRSLYEFARFVAEAYRDGLPPDDDALRNLVATAGRLTGHAPDPSETAREQ